MYRSGNCNKSHRLVRLERASIITWLNPDEMRATSQIRFRKLPKECFLPCWCSLERGSVHSPAAG